LYNKINFAPRSKRAVSRSKHQLFNSLTADFYENNTKYKKYTTWTASRIFECKHKERVTPESGLHAGLAFRGLIFSIVITWGLRRKTEELTNLFAVGTANPQYTFF